MLRSKPQLMGTLIALTTFLFIFSLSKINNDRIRRSINQYNKASKRPTFLEIATKYGTDKVTTHSYHHMYAKYLEPLRDGHIKMLEIGLGCNMAYGPGASYHLWLEYLPHVDLYYIEYDAACAEKWRSKTTRAKVFTGDQADIPFLQEFITKSGGSFDVIVDDGGHTMKQQLTSFDILFPILKPGGIYICEDLQTSYWDNFGGGPADMKGTMMERVRSGLNDLMEKKERLPHMRDVWSVDCMAEVCAWSKKVKGEKY